MTLIAIFASAAQATPTASYTVTPAIPQSGVAATFTSTSTAPDLAVITATDWDFDGNGTVDATGAEVQHTFPTSGTYTVNMTVTSSELLLNTATASKEVV